MPRALFKRLFTAVRNEPWWRRSINATGRLQSYPIQNLLAALRVLGNGEPYDCPDEYYLLSPSTIAEATRRLTHLIGDKWEATYLRRPTEDELKHILTRNAARGMPGCIGSIDCTHWQWLKCPNALAGQYHDHKGKRSVVVESICDEDTYIWHFFIGAPGSYNAMNVLTCSSLMRDVNANVWPPRNINYTLNGRTRRLHYYTADQGYLRYALFAMTHPNPVTPKRRMYNRLQQAVRKDAERLYAFIPSRLNIILRPACFTKVLRMINTGNVVAILHNMAIECTRGDVLAQRRIDAAAEARQAVADLQGQRQGPGNEKSDCGSRQGRPAAARAASERQPEFFIDNRPKGPGAWGSPQPGEHEAQDDMVETGTEQEVVPGSLRYTDGAECEAKDRDAHFAPLHDLSEHIFADRGRLLLPHS